MYTFRIHPNKNSSLLIIMLHAKVNFSPTRRFPKRWMRKCPYHYRQELLMLKLSLNKTKYFASSEILLMLLQVQIISLHQKFFHPLLGTNIIFLIFLNIFRRDFDLSKQKIKLMGIQNLLTCTLLLRPNQIKCFLSLPACSQLVPENLFTLTE